MNWRYASQKRSPDRVLSPSRQSEVCTAYGDGGKGGVEDDDQNGPTNDSQGDGILQEGGDNAKEDLYWDIWTNTTSKTFYSHLANDQSTTLTVKVIKENVSFVFTIKTTSIELRPALLGSGFAAVSDLNEEETALARVNGVRAQSGYTWVLTKEGDPTPPTLYSTVADGDVFVFTYTANP